MLSSTQVFRVFCVAVALILKPFFFINNTAHTIGLLTNFKLLVGWTEEHLNELNYYRPCNNKCVQYVIEYGTTTKCIFVNHLILPKLRPFRISNTCRGVEVSIDFLLIPPPGIYAKKCVFFDLAECSSGHTYSHSPLYRKYKYKSISRVFFSITRNETYVMRAHCNLPNSKRVGQP